MRNHLKGSVAVLALLGGPAIAQEAEGLVVETCAPVVTVTQTPPEIRITIPEDAAADPQVVVLQSPPVVEVVQCPPVITGGEAQITEAEAEIVVNAAETAELVVTRVGPDEAAADTATEATDDAPAEADAAADEAATGDAAADGTATDEAATDTAADEAAADLAAADAATEQAATEEAAAGATGDQAAQPPAGLVGEGETVTVGETDAAAAQPVDQAADTAAPDAAEAEAAPQGADAPAQDGDAADAQTEATGDSAAGPTGAVQPGVSTDETPPATTLNTQAEATEGPVSEGMPVEEGQPDGAVSIEPAPGATGAGAATAADPAAGMPAEAPQGQPLLREGNAALTPEEAAAEGLEGADVVASDDEVVGQIGAADAASGTILVGVGGFLGLGERDLMLPMDEVSFQRDADGVLRAYLAVPSDAVEAMAEQQAGEAAQ
ncbi:hypothetical protein [Paracoccus sp. (in: a-proteobacteria)]|uniref:hypothetical protein n=1 Tax=Paracoccus sp. TaxID=267 RepID=UPI00272AD8C0|nr:hypothetical protein [Paracoccus sp. (in: a-proteobacteria)]